MKKLSEKSVITQIKNVKRQAVAKGCAASVLDGVTYSVVLLVAMEKVLMQTDY